MQIVPILIVVVNFGHYPQLDYEQGQVNRGKFLNLKEMASARFTREKAIIPKMFFVHLLFAFPNPVLDSARSKKNREGDKKAPDPASSDGVRA